MKILIVSDSHASLRFIRHCLTCVAPDLWFHLGDYYDDGLAMAEAFPKIPYYGVPGNCDRFRCPPDCPETRIQKIDGVCFMITHGHRQGVKMDLHRLLQEARRMRADIVCYGHTHCPDCHREEDGLWVVNPGSCGDGNTAAIAETADGKILGISIVRETDLEEIE